MTSIRWKLPDTLQILHEYWQMKRIGSALPQFSDIALTEIPLVTPHLLLLDVLRAGEDFRYRHIGQALSQAVGTDYTGRRMSEALQGGPYLDYVLAINREVVNERRPLYAESSFRGKRLASRWTSRLILPLRVWGDGVEMLMAAQIFGGRDLNAPAPSYAKTAEFEEGVRVLLD